MAEDRCKDVHTAIAHGPTKWMRIWVLEDWKCWRHKTFKMTTIFVAFVFAWICVDWLSPGARGAAVRRRGSSSAGSFSIHPASGAHPRSPRPLGTQTILHNPYWFSWWSRPGDPGRDAMARTAACLQHCCSSCTSACGRLGCGRAVGHCTVVFGKAERRSHLSLGLFFKYEFCIRCIYIYIYISNIYTLHVMNLIL